MEKYEEHIAKLQKENEELKNNTRKNENELEFDVDCDWIALQKILDKSDEQVLKKYVMDCVFGVALN